jgi:hypothetical protein
MSAEIAAGYCGELTVKAFLERVGKEYPRPRVKEGRRQLWLRDDLDRAIARDMVPGDSPRICDVGAAASTLCGGASACPRFGRFLFPDSHLLPQARLRDGEWRRTGEGQIMEVTPRAADKIYDKIINGPNGTRLRQGEKVVGLCRKVWRIMRRLHPELFDKKHPNPWDEDVLSHLPKQGVPMIMRRIQRVNARAMPKRGPIQAWKT